MRRRQAQPRSQRRSPSRMLMPRASKLFATTADIMAALTMVPVTTASRSRRAMPAGVMVVSDVAATPARAMRTSFTPPIQAGGVPGFGPISEQRLTERHCKRDRLPGGLFLLVTSASAHLLSAAFNRAMVMSISSRTYRNREHIRRQVVDRCVFAADPLRCGREDQD